MDAASRTIHERGEDVGIKPVWRVRGELRQDSCSMEPIVGFVRELGEVWVQFGHTKVYMKPNLARSVWARINALLELNEVTE